MWRCCLQVDLSPAVTVMSLFQTHSGKTLLWLSLEAALQLPFFEQGGTMH